MEKFVAFSNQWRGVIAGVLTLVLPALGLHFGDDAAYMFNETWDKVAWLVCAGWSMHGFRNGIVSGTPITFNPFGK